MLLLCMLQSLDVWRYK